MITEQDLQYIKECFNEISADVEQNILYFQYAGTTTNNKARGERAENQYNEIPLKGEVSQLTLEAVQTSGGRFVQGDIEIKILGLEQVKITDKIKWNEQTFNVVEFEPVFLNKILGFVVRCHKIE